LFNPTYAYNPYPTKKVSKHLPFLSVPAYISSFAPRTFPEEITVTHPPYLGAVSRIVARTPDHVIAGYFVTRLALTYAGELGAEVGIRKEYQRLQDVLRGTKPGAEEDRNDVCLAAVDGVVGYLAGAEYVKEAFPPKAKRQAEDIILCTFRCVES
jgi:endothelin-converting enzyme